MLLRLPICDLYKPLNRATSHYPYADNVHCSKVTWSCHAPAYSAEMHENSLHRNFLSVAACVSASRRFTSSKSTELGWCFTYTSLIVPSAHIHQLMHKCESNRLIWHESGVRYQRKLT